MQFNACGIKVKISFLSISIVTLLMLLYPNNAVMLTVSAAMIHEMGHLLFLIFYKDKQVKVNISIFGMRIIRTNKVALNIRQEILTALAGPAFNIVIAMISSLLGNSMFTAVNLSLAIFNLLPIMELDGGRAIFYALKNYIDEDKAEKVCLWISLIILFPLAVIGWCILINSRGNFSLFAVSVYLISLLIFRSK